MTKLQAKLGNSNIMAHNRFFKFLNLSPIGWAAFVALCVVPLLIDDQYILYLMVSSLMMGTLAMGFDFTAGFINIVNFGYAAFMGTGAYTAALFVTRLNLSPWLAMLAGALLAALFGFLIGVLTLRLRGMFAALMAWFFGIVLMNLAASMVDLTRGHRGLNVPLLLDTSDRTYYVYVILAITIIGYISFRLIANSSIGLAFRAIGQDLEAAESSGISATKFKLFNFTVSCFFAGLVGGFYSFFIGVLTPEIMHTRETVEILAVAYIGGRGTLWGPLLAAFLIIPLFEYLRPLMEIRFVLYGLLLAFVMIYRPGGLAGLLIDIMDFIKRKLGSKVSSF